MLGEKPERFVKFLALLLKLEGGTVDNKSDKGGLTNLGVTQATYSEFLTKNQRKDKSVKQINREDVEDIYFENYYSKVNFIEEEFPHYLLFDLAVNSGPGRTKQCIREVSNPHNAADILTWRRQYYNKIVAANPTQQVFLKGWMNRLKIIQKNFEVSDA